MPDHILYIILGFLISLVIGRICIPNIIIISKKKRLIDIPNERKVHSAYISRLGGISFLPAIIISYGLTRGLFWWICGEYSISDPVFIKDVLFFMSGLMIIFSTGLTDDIMGLSYKRKIFLQFLAALILVIPMGYINNLYGLFGIYSVPAFAGIPLTILLVLTVINAYNLIDGVDGLCSGLSLLMLISSGAWFYINGNAGLSLMAACTTGVVLAFFMYNVFGQRLKIFMGDGGSLVMGYIISFFSLQFIIQENPIVNEPNGRILMIALSMIFVPLFDTTRVFVTRIFHGKSPFNADKTHVHHKLLRLGFTHIQSTMILICVQASYIILNIVLSPRININFMFALNIGIAMLLISILNIIYKNKFKSAAQNL